MAAYRSRWDGERSRTLRDPHLRVILRGDYCDHVRSEAKNDTSSLQARKFTPLHHEHQAQHRNDKTISGTWLLRFAVPLLGALISHAYFRLKV
jgi:hypothetical protein